MGESPDSRGSTGLEWAIRGVALLMIAYHIWSVWFPMFNALLHQNIHLGFSLVLLFLAAMRKKRRWVKFLFGLAAVLSFFCVVYVHFESERLDMWAGFLEMRDYAIGIVLVFLVVYITWKHWGIVFPILVGSSVLYAWFGHHIKGPLGHPPFAPQLIISNLGIGFDGIYGMLLNASVNLIFLFIIFGSLFEAVGINRLFLEIGTFLGRRLRGGAAQTAVFSSLFVGMCTGAAAANVALTGSYTIPLMKKMGYKPHQAGAIEAAASTGGQLTPPVMGVSVFLMASFLGVSYASLMAIALVPALTYYLLCMFGVILIASRLQIPILTEKVNRAIIIRGFPLFIFPMGLITFLLIKHYSPAYAAFFAIFTLLAISLLRKETRPSAKLLISGMVKGAIMGASIGVVCATIGMFTKMLTFTGAGPKLGGLIQTAAGGNLFIGMLCTMLLTIFLGFSMPTPVAYAVTALIVAPVLMDMGLTQLVSHLFVFYYAILAAITPPVAPAAMVGSKIAEASYIKTGWESFKLVLPFCILPFFLPNNPIILSQGEPFFEGFRAIGGLFVACSSLLFFCQGFFLEKTRPLERVLFFLTATLAAYDGFTKAHIAAWILAVFLYVSVLLVQWRRRNVSKHREKAEVPQVTSISADN